ncbi:MAG: hypothetical protein ACYTEQ_01450 [Planctomycetota bacterium]|jgi:hypothetical protein
MGAAGGLISSVLGGAMDMKSSDAQATGNAASALGGTSVGDSQGSLMGMMSPYKGYGDVGGMAGGNPTFGSGNNSYNTAMSPKPQSGGGKG